MGFRFPRNDEHMAIVGRNGTGKTQFGVHVLSKKNLRRETVVILDYKGDELINGIQNTREIGFGEVPRKPGLYILHSSPDEEAETDAWLSKLNRAEDCGLFIDEGYMLPPRSKIFKTILTQGRSKRIPVITLSQRPVDVQRYAFSESSHFAFFPLNDRRDIDVIRQFTPEDFIDYMPVSMGGEKRLPDYYSRWYSVKSDERFVLMPAPSAEEIIASIDAQLEPKTRFL